MTDWTTCRMTPEMLAELRWLLDAATPGPWRDEMMQGDGVTLTAIVAGKPNPDDLRVVGSTLAHNDARVLIAAVNALPALLDAAAERDRLAECVRAYGRTIDRWGLLIIAATHSEDITTPDGDGDWEVIESRLAEVPALLAERDALAAKLDAVRALHHREVRWGNEDYSIDAEEYADRKTENDEVDAGWGLDALAAFDVCAECYRVEQSIEQRDGVAVLEGLWPCPTARALDAETGGES